ncbi:type II secretion system protein GspD [Candidatus Mesenet endosymbiont of Agriotes lineatus]|uniref:type II secretion system protein GspD n=1 Tax=Candidatus Mesenet endosymbiont of Agriotes lineatus TaxID=3077948 RepID=UPI00397764DA
MLLSVTACVSSYKYNTQYMKAKAADEIEESYLKKNKAEPEVPAIINMPLYFPVLDESDKLISININSSTPVIDLLTEIGRLADINLSIDPKISGSIVLKLKDKPVDEVLQTIAKSAKIRYRKHDDVFSIEQDLPYTHNYYIDFINIQRSTESNFVVNNKIISNTNEDSTIVSGSDNKIKSKYDGDLWFSLERNLSALIDINGTNDDEFYSTNREAGIITLSAREDIHKAVKEYISKVRELTSSQVMIEAKVVEVTLDDMYQSGIDWENLSYINRFGQQTGVLTTSYSDLEDVVRALSKFGASKVISSPRLHALNNQQAIMSFTQNHVYFTADIKKHTDAGDFSILSTMNSVPVGIILTIQPSIDVIDKEIFMNVHPILSRVNGYVKDPGTEYAIQKSKLNVSSNIPIVEVREIDSMLKIKSGEIMVIGGVIEHRSVKKNAKLKKINKSTKTVETVIFLKATIIPPFGLLGL